MPTIAYRSSSRSSAATRSSASARNSPEPRRSGDGEASRSEERRRLPSSCVHVREELSDGAAQLEAVTAAGRREDHGGLGAIDDELPVGAVRVHADLRESALTVGGRDP